VVNLIRLCCDDIQLIISINIIINYTSISWPQKPDEFGILHYYVEQKIQNRYSNVLEAFCGALTTESVGQESATTPSNSTSNTIIIAKKRLLAFITTLTLLEPVLTGEFDERPPPCAAESAPLMTKWEERRERGAIDVEDFANFFGENKIYLERYRRLLKELKVGYEELGHEGLEREGNSMSEAQGLDINSLVNKLITISAAVEAEPEVQDGDAFVCAREIAAKKMKAKESGKNTRSGESDKNTGKGSGKGKGVKAQAGGKAAKKNANKNRSFAALRGDSSDDTSGSNVSSSDSDDDSGSDSLSSMQIESDSTVEREGREDWTDREANLHRYKSITIGRKSEIFTFLSNIPLDDNDDFRQ
jgi:hypothetical protein